MHASHARPVRRFHWDPVARATKFSRGGVGTGFGCTQISGCPNGLALGATFEQHAGPLRDGCKDMDGYLPGSIWPADDEDAIQIREVYSRYGLAMYQAQVLEHGMVNAVIIAQMLPTMRGYPGRSAWEDAFNRTYDVELAKTFGNMLKALLLLDLPEELLGRLRGAKSERDRLAHRFFREHDVDFLGRAGRTRMIAECEDAIEMFSEIDADLDEHMRPLRERHGITSEWIEGHLAAALATASTDDATSSAPDSAKTRRCGRI